MSVDARPARVSVLDLPRKDDLLTMWRQSAKCFAIALHQYASDALNRVACAKATAFVSPGQARIRDGASLHTLYGREVPQCRELPTKGGLIHFLVMYTHYIKIW